MRRHYYKTRMDPITIDSSWEYCAGAQMHCLRCQNSIEIRFEPLQDDWLVIDLPWHRCFRSTRSDVSWVDNPENYHRGSWQGLEKRPDSVSDAD